MRELRQNSATTIAVALSLKADGTPANNVLFSDLTVFIGKAGAVMVQKNVLNADWTVARASAGLYRLALAAEDVDTVGELLITIEGAAFFLHIANYEVVARQESETYGLVSAIPTTPLLSDDARLPATVIAAAADLPAEPPTAAEVSTAVWAEEIFVNPGENVAARQVLADARDASMSASQDTGTIRSKTDALPASPASTGDVTTAAAGVISALPPAPDNAAIATAVWDSVIPTGTPAAARDVLAETHGGAVVSMQNTDGIRDTVNATLDAAISTRATPADVQVTLSPDTALTQEEHTKLMGLVNPDNTTIAETKTAVDDLAAAVANTTPLAPPVGQASEV